MEKDPPETESDQQEVSLLTVPLSQTHGETCTEHTESGLVGCKQEHEEVTLPTTSNVQTKEHVRTFSDVS